MEKIIAEGKTTTEAVNNGLKQLKVPREMVNVKVLDEDNKRMFYSILAPRVVKVELTVKENFKNKPLKRKTHKKAKIVPLTEEQFEKSKVLVGEFLDKLFAKLDNTTTYEIYKDNNYLKVSIQNPKLGYLIGYRGEALYALQEILTQIATNGEDDVVKAILDINNYRKKREDALKNLADKIAQRVVENKNSKKLEPMNPYERKIIHTQLQDVPNVETFSVGEEPNRCLIISYKN